MDMRYVVVKMSIYFEVFDTETKETIYASTDETKAWVAACEANMEDEYGNFV